MGYLLVDLQIQISSADIIWNIFIFIFLFNSIQIETSQGVSHFELIKRKFLV